MQLHFRYELGFMPSAIDGKRHELRVRPTNEAKDRHKGIRLRSRPQISLWQTHRLGLGEMESCRQMTK
jgi:hypothetical protein